MAYHTFSQGTMQEQALPLIYQALFILTAQLKITLLVMTVDAGPGIKLKFYHKTNLILLFRSLMPQMTVYLHAIHLQTLFK